ncbi:dUTPase [Exiguobacterium sp. BMC-KP]|uniref:dUTPase n=1 Tax=Exiguobacterium sp. BMC-KP TaxID=1684312 RepID=UPI0006AA2B35|nr:dUTPase [Exiguobacterium sp. BMC-KP]
MTHEPRPLILSLDTLEAICQKQVTLDESICASRGITPDEFANDLHTKRYVAMVVEAGETINETKTFKYWSNGKCDPKKLLEEAIDWLHFYASLLMTDHPKASARRVEYERALFEQDTLFLQNEKLDRLYLCLMQSDRNAKMFAAWSIILEWFGYTETDIIGMYEHKQGINYRRIMEAY